LNKSIPKKPVILCFVAYYLPGYRSGGPVRTISNFVDDDKPYTGIRADNWCTVGKAHVFYASVQTLSLGGIAQLIRDTPHDLLYLNSFFSIRFTILPLLSRLFLFSSRKPCVIAPRGEFSPAAIEIRKPKKILFLVLSRLIGLYRNLLWQAS
jgi:hypothetical protein